MKVTKLLQKNEKTKNKSGYHKKSAVLLLYIKSSNTAGEGDTKSQLTRFGKKKYNELKKCNKLRKK